LRRIPFLILLALPLTLLVGSAEAVPGQMGWTDTGQSGGGPITFTAAAPLCPSGTVRDVGGITGIKMQHTCADGSGTFEFEVAGTGSFHFSAGGTGRYASLRGTGSCSVVQNDDGTFARSCHALADFDSTAPAVTVKSLDFLLSGRRGFALQAAFQASDNVAGNAVKYRLSVTAAGRALTHASGVTTGGLVRLGLKGRIPKHARRLTVSVRVVDPLGNARTVVRTSRVRR